MNVGYLHMFTVLYVVSVRISSQKQYNTGESSIRFDIVRGVLNVQAGLFVLDLNHAPWGCGKFA